MVNNCDNKVPTEVSVLKQVCSGPTSEHIVHAFDYWFSVDPRRLTSRTFIKLQRCEETLGDYLVKLQEKGFSTEPLVLIEIMIQISSGVWHCHKRLVGHRDLKESNGNTCVFYMLTLAMRLDGSCTCHPSHRSKSRWLVTDFSFSAQNLNSDSFVVSYQGRGTPTYRAPELIRPSKADRTFCQKSDSWSLGCILFKVATTNQRSAFDSDFDVADFALNPNRPTPQLHATDNVNLQQAILSPEGNYVPIWQQINTILKDCFTREPKARPKVEELKDKFEGIWNAMTRSSEQSTES